MSEPGTARRLRIVTDPSRNPSDESGSNLSEAPSDELVRRSSTGERGAFDELVRRTHRDAYGLALRLTGDEEDARDVVQDAYLRAYRGLDRFRGEARFSTWLYRIVANCASTHLGKRRRHRHDELPDEALVADLGISVGAAKVRLHRARRRLREQVFPLRGEEVHAV